MRRLVTTYISLALVVVLVTVWWGSVSDEASSQQANVIDSIDSTEQVEEKQFPNVLIQGKAGIVFDITTGEVLYSKNENVQLPLASITKVMTVYAALNNLTPNYQVDITEEDFAVEGSSGLLVGDSWELAELARFSLVNSSNDGASAIARTVGEAMKGNFIDLMNSTAKEKNMTQTFFVNPTGLDGSETQASTFGSAKDVAVLLAAASADFPDVFYVTTEAQYDAVSMGDRLYPAINTNADSELTTGITASKTGYTDIAGGNLGIVVEVAPARPIAVVVLGSSKEGRFTDVKRLTDATISYLSN